MHGHFYPSPAAAAAAAASGGGVALSVVGHPGFHHHPDTGHALHLGFPPSSVPILSLVSPALFAPAYAFLTHVPAMQRRAAGAASNGVAVANGNGGGNGGGNAGGSGADRVSNGVVGNGAAPGGGPTGGGGLRAVGSGGVNGEGCVSSNGGAGHRDGGSHSRARLQASTLPPEPRPIPRKPQGLSVLALPPGTIPDNRDEVMARASLWERRRRIEGRTTCAPDAIPEVRGPGCVDAVGFRDCGRRRAEEDEAAWRTPRGGWHLLPDGDCDTNPASSLTSGIPSSGRSDPGWGLIPSSLTSSPVAACAGGNWEEGESVTASVTDSAAGSVNGSATGDAGRVEEPAWSSDLAGSVGVVTDLVLPSHSAAMGFCTRGVGWEAATWGGDEEEDEEEREIAKALEVSGFRNRKERCTMEGVTGFPSSSDAPLSREFSDWPRTP